MSSKFEIAGLEVKPGTKQRGYLRVGPYFYHKRAYIRKFELIPFTVIRGSKDGPVLVQTACTHPTEYAGLDATIRLSKDLKPEDLKGTFIGVPLINTLGFYERTYINPIDGKNIQGIYPGKADGTISEMIAYGVFNEIVLKANYFLDCHGSDIHESNLWEFFYYGTDDDVEKKSLEIAKATNLTYLHRSVYHGSLGQEAAKRGIPGGLYELCTGDKIVPEDSNAIYDATLNVMRHLKMIGGKPTPIKGQMAVVEGQKQEVFTKHAGSYFTKSGIYHTEIKPGDLVTKGQVLGKVTDLWGDVVETIYAPATGRIGSTMHNPIVNAGDSVVGILF